MIYLTHDIDWLNPLHPYSVIKTITHGKKWINTSQLFNPNIFVDGITQLLALNQAHQTNSIWHIGAPSTQAFHRFGLRYNTNSKAYQKVISELLNAKVEIGLHSTTYETINKQAESLTRFTQKPIQYHRSHFLHYNSQTLYSQLAAAGITNDFSLGEARKISLPKVTSTYENIQLIPTILFDNIFFFEAPETVFEQFKQCLKTAQTQQKDVAILFHPENFLINSALKEYYQETLRIIKSI